MTTTSSASLTPSRSGRVPVNGLSVYYEVYGELDAPATVPLLVIPGGFMATDQMASWVSSFAATRTVISFDQQGHGRTPNTSRAMSYEQFADDAATLLDALAVARADVLGYSQGGGVALQLALRHPLLVTKLVCVSASYRQDGLYPSVLQAIDGLTAAAFAGTTVETAFTTHTPDRQAFETYVDKMRILGVNDQHISDDQIRSITVPTMIIIGDADVVKPEHAVSMFELRGGGDPEAAATANLHDIPPARLVILPATSHLGVWAASPVLVPMVTAFLDDVPPPAADLF